MALNSSTIKGNGGGDRVEQPVIDAGVYPARIAQIIDMGLQAQRPYQGKDKPPANEINITYELVDTFMVDEDGNERLDAPRWLSEQLPLYDVSKAEKAKCTQRYKAADPNNNFGGDFSKIGGTAVNVSVVHNKQGDKLYTNVAAIATMRAKDAEKCAELQKPPKVFDLDEPDMEVFAGLPQWIQDRIKGNLNFQGSKLQAALGGKPVEAPKAPEQAPEAPVEDAADEKPWG